MTTLPTAPSTAAPELDATVKIGDEIASLVYWTFKGTAITPEAMKGLMVAAGRNPDDVPEIQAAEALAFAIRNFSVREGRERVKEAVIASIDKATGQVTVNILKLARESKRRAVKTPVDTMVFDLGAKAWVEAGSDPHSANLREAVAHRLKYLDGNHVRDLVVMPALAESAAFTIKRGLYVVPKDAASPLAAAQKALSVIETFNLHVANVRSGDGWEAPLKESATDFVKSELSNLNEQIEGWLQSSMRVRSDTRGTVIARFDDLAKRAALYEASLSVVLDDLRADLGDMKARALDIIQQKDDEADKKSSSRASKPAPSREDVQAARRANVASWSPEKRAKLWAMLGDGTDLPEGEDEAVNALVAVLP